MRAALLIPDLSDLVNNKRPQPELLDAVDDACGVPNGVDEENRAFCKGRHLAEDDLDRALADLGCDGEEELAALGDLALDPHVALHERDEGFRDRQDQTRTSVFLYLINN